jgi:hypothetical protein
MRNIIPFLTPPCTLNNDADSFLCTGLNRPRGCQKFEASRIFSHSTHEIGKIISASNNNVCKRKYFTLKSENTLDQYKNTTLQRLAISYAMCDLLLAVRDSYPVTSSFVIRKLLLHSAVSTRWF